MHIDNNQVFLPEEIQLAIFTHLELSDKKSMLSTCKNWHNKNFAELIPNIKKFGIMQYLGLRNNFDFLETIDRIKAFNVMQRMQDQIKNDDCIAILSLPIGLTINTLLQLTKKPLKDVSFVFHLSYPTVLKEIENEPKQTMQHLFITTKYAVYRNESIKKRSETIQNLGWKTAEYLPALTLVALQIIKGMETPQMIMCESKDERAYFWPYIRPDYKDQIGTCDYEHLYGALAQYDLSLLVK
jgi:hypothetical protein